MLKCARRSDGRGLSYLFACVLKYIYLLIFLFKKKRGPERGPEGGPEGGPKGGFHVLSTPVCMYKTWA